MITDQQAQQMLREAIVRRLEMLRDEYIHWLNELKKLDDVTTVREDETRLIAVNEFLPPNVVRMPRRG
jgi:hypothetical protein